MKKSLIIEIEKIYKIFKNDNFNNIKTKLKSIISKLDFVTPIEIETIFEKVNIQYTKIINFKKIQEKQVYFIAIKNKEHFEIGHLYLKNNLITIKIKNNLLKIKKTEINQINFLAIWQIDGVKDIEAIKQKMFPGINELKIKYGTIFVLLDLIIVGLMLLGNFYLKIVIDNVIPNQDQSFLIQISIFFLVIFLITLILEQIIFLMKKKIVNHNAKLYYAKLIDYLNSIDCYEIKKIDYQHFQNFNNSITNVIQYHIFLVPDIITNLINIILIGIIFMFISPYFVLIQIALLFGIVIFNFFKLKANGFLMKKQIENKNDIEKWINQFYFFIQEEKNKQIYEQFKLKITSSIQDFEDNDVRLSLQFKKIEIIESFFKKFTITMTTVLFAWLIIFQQSSNLVVSISTLVYVMTLMSTLISSTQELFNNVVKIPQCKFYQPYFEKINNHVIKKQANKVSIIGKIHEIRILKPRFLKSCTKKNLLLRNDTLILGKSGIGKTFLVKSIFAKNSNEKIYINKILAKHLKDKWIKENIIYYNSKFNESILNIENLLYGNMECTWIIANLIKKHKIDISNFENLSSGQKQFVKFLSLLAFKNKIIILDEPLSNVDTEFKKEIIFLLKKYLSQANFILWISHDHNITKLFKYKLEVR